MAQKTSVIPVVLAGSTRALVEATIVTDDSEFTPFNLDDERQHEVASFADVMDDIELVAKSFADAMKRVAPDKASVQFGVALGGETGKITSLFVKGTLEANLVVTLEWSGSDSSGK
jgi:hypothetical protein